MAKRLTDRTLRAAKPKAQPYDIFDTDVPGVAARILPGGGVTFCLVTRYPGSSNPARRKLGTYPALSLAAARDRARSWLALIERGIDPAHEAERVRRAEQLKRKNSFAHVADDFTRLKLAGERQGREAAQQLQRFVALWGGRPITEITRSDIRQVIEAGRDRPYMAHNFLALLRRFFQWALDRECIETNPAWGIKAHVLVGRKRPRDRVLSADELRALWHAAETLGYPYGDCLKLLLLTGARRGEWSASRWREIDLRERLLVVPSPRQKSGRAHTIPLAPATVAILEALPRFEGGDFLFSMTGKRPISGFSKLKTELDELMRAELGDLPPFVVHDLRRTVRTQLSALPGVSVDIAELCIGHSVGGLRAVYDRHSYLSERRDALERWAQRLRSIVEPATASDNVITLPPVVAR
jgi:integrase